VFLYHFDALISKMIFKKYKILFDTFLSKKYFERQLQPHFSNKFSSVSTLVILIHPCKKINIYKTKKRKKQNKSTGYHKTNMESKYKLKNYAWFIYYVLDWYFEINWNKIDNNHFGHPHE